VTNQAPTVLVADDDDTVRRVVAFALPLYGFRVLAAADGEEALALYREHGHEVSLVLLDVFMPGLDGPETFQALREIDPDVRCCFMTGYPGPRFAESLLALGAELFIPKPFMPAELARSLWQLVRSTPVA
jgi:CheY-like chemotaxis protein